MTDAEVAAAVAEIRALLDAGRPGDGVREISRRCGVSNRFVTTLREEASVNRSQTRLFERGGAVHEIARRCGVSNQFVSNLRAVTVNDGQSDQPRLFTTRHGAVAEMDSMHLGNFPRRASANSSQTHLRTVLRWSSPAFSSAVPCVPRCLRIFRRRILQRW